MTLSIPLASRQTVFTLHKATVVSMHQSIGADAIPWRTVSEFVAISEDLPETALVTQDQLQKCIGSTKYKICHDTMQRKHPMPLVKRHCILVT